MLSRWKGLRTGKVLPLDTPANQFQYVHHMHFEHDAMLLFIGAKEGRGEWHIQIVDPSGNVIFEQIVFVRIMVVTLAYVANVFFTWYFRGETITTPIVGGQPTSEENPSWSHTIGNSPLSEFGNLDPGGGAGQTNLTVEIDTSWESPVYNMTIPPGSTLKVIKDSWGFGLSNRPEYQFRFTLGEYKYVAAAYGQFNELLTAHQLNDSQDIEIAYSREPNSVLVTRGYIRDAWDPTLLVLPTGIGICGVMQKDGYFEYKSDDYYSHWLRSQYPDEFGVTSSQEIFGPNTQMPGLTNIGNVRIALGAEAGKLVSRTITDEGIGEPIRFGSIGNSQDYAITSNEQGEVVVVDNSGLPKWISNDLGKFYSPVNQEEE